MELRKHSSIARYRGLRNWPPVWTSIGGKEKKCIWGEVGILKEAKTAVISPEFRMPGDRPPAKCFLFAEYEGDTYMSRLLFDDPLFCQRITKLLENYHGHHIRDIAGIDLQADDQSGCTADNTDSYNRL